MPTLRAGDADRGAVSEALLDLAESDPHAAIAEARRMLDRPGQPSHRAAHALRAIGLARRTLGDAQKSVDALQEAVSIAEAAGDAALRGEMELSLAASVAFAGDLPRAFTLLDAADGRLDERGRAHVAVQRAGLMARTGDFAGCLPLYAAAEPVLERHEDRRWLALLSSNRGLVHVYTGRLRAAERDLQRARDIYEELGRASSSAEMVHNLGFLAMRRGDIPGALAALDDAERRFRKLRLNLAVVFLDQAEALLLAGLAGDARDLATAAQKRFSAAGMEIERSEALLTHARAALAAGDPTSAAQSALEAQHAMAAQGRPGWELRARYLAAAAGVDADSAGLSDLAADLAGTGQISAAFHTRLLAGRAALAAGDVPTAERELDAAGRPPRYAPVDVRVQAWLARALLRRRRDPAGAAAAVAAGVRLIEEYRATFGSTESRVNVATHATELLELGQAMALESGRPSRILRWTERARAGSLRLVQPRPPEDADLAAMLAALRSAQSDLREAELEGHASVAMWRELAQLERSVRRLDLQRKGRGATVLRLSALRDIQSMLDGRAMVVLTGIGGEMVALRIRRRSIRKYLLGPLESILAHAGRIRRAQRSLAGRTSDNAAGAHRRALRRAAEAFDTAVFAPLRLAERHLVVVPPPQLQAFPWSMLPSCAERTITISPSAFAWHRAAATPARPGNTLLVAGPGLEHADDEIERISVLYPEARVLVGNEATVGNVLAALDGAALAHFACHARFRAENAMFSALILADGELTVYDLEGRGGAPDVVVLSACDSGLSQAHAGEELTGLAAALLGMGARNLIVAAAPVPDEPATALHMFEIHRELVAGATPATALAQARSGLGPHAGATRDAFYCLGA